MEKDKKLYLLEKQIEGIETTIHNLKETNKHLNEENYYLREKNDQVELSIYHKESAIDSLKKQVYQYTDELQKFEGDLKNSEL
jgi:regulator of replication initiation timing